MRRSRTGLAFVGVALSTVLHGIGAAPAQPAMPPAIEPAKSVQGTVSYQGVDASTVRVFAIGNVGTESIELGDGETIYVATPAAGHGTGFMVGNDGLLLTAQHVVDKARHVVVRLPGEQGFTPARTVVTSKKSDLAVLSIEKEVPAIELLADSTPLPVRMTVFALGYPLDPSRTQAQSSRGIVSGARDDGAIQLDISVNPGNSGGPLVNESHHVVGMVVAAGDVTRGVQGIGIAVPLWKLKRAVVEARRRIDNGTVAPISPAEMRSAAVVDMLIQRGALYALGERKDLNTTVDQQIFEQELDSIGEGIEDSDLLVFLAGNLWNAQLILEHGGASAVYGKEITERNVRILSRRLRKRVKMLVARALDLDSGVAKRSPFAARIARDFRIPRSPDLASNGESPMSSRSRPELFSFGAPPGFADLPSDKTILQLRAETLFFSDNDSIPLGVAMGVAGLVGHTIQESDDSRTRLHVGGSAILGAASEVEIGPDDEPEVLQRNVRKIARLYLAEIGLSHTFGGPGTPSFLEASWTPGLTRLSTTEFREYYASQDTDPLTTELSDRESIELVQARVACGWHRGGLRYWGSLRMHAHESGTMSGWFGLGVDLSL